MIVWNRDFDAGHAEQSSAMVLELPSIELSSFARPGPIKDAGATESELTFLKFCHA